MGNALVGIPLVGVLVGVAVSALPLRSGHCHYSLSSATTVVVFPRSESLPRLARRCAGASWLQSWLWSGVALHVGVGVCVCAQTFSATSDPDPSPDPDSDAPAKRRASPCSDSDRRKTQTVVAVPRP